MIVESKSMSSLAAFGGVCQCLLGHEDDTCSANVLSCLGPVGNGIQP